MSRYFDQSRLRRILTGALLFLGLFTPGARAKIQAPLTSSLQLLTTPTLGGQGRLIWAGVPELTPASAKLIFTVTLPGGRITSSTQPLSMTRGRASDATFSLTTPQPGTYKAGAHLIMTTHWGRFSQSQTLDLVVPERGRAYLAAQPVLSARQYGARASGRRPLLAAALGAGAPQATPWTVQGAFRFTNKLIDETGITGTRLDPVRRATVQILLTRQGQSTATLGTASTNEMGAFSLTLPTTSTTGAGLLVRLEARSDAAWVVDRASTQYRYDTPVANWKGGPLNLGTIDLEASQSGPWNICDAILQASDYVRQITGAAVPPVRCRWAVGNSDGTYFTHANNTISILGTEEDPDEFDDAVLMHEYGHFIAANYSMDKNPGGEHSWFSHISPQLAWSEGWASFFSSAVRNSPYYLDTSGIFGIMALDLEQPTDDVTGDDNEGAVAATLWDIFDAHSDNRDRLSDGIGNIWYVFTHYFTFRRQCVIRDLFDGWIASNRGHIPEVQDIFAEHGISYPKIIVTSMLINNGAAKTNATTVTLNNVCIGTPAAWLASEDASFKGAIWKPWSKAPAFGLSGTDGNKGVYFKVRNGAGEESAPVDDEIILRSIPITPLAIDGPVIDGGVVTEFDYDLYSFKVTKAGQYTIDTVSGTLTDSVMDLYGPNSQTTLIEENDDGHGPMDYMSRITRTLQPGTYYVKVKGFIPETGTYSVWVVSGAGDPLMPQLKIDGPAASGGISFDRNTPENWFRFKITEAGPYTLQTTAGTLYDSIMDLYGPDSQTRLLEMDEDGGRGYMSMISRTLTPGIYYVKVTSYSKSNDGSYTIALYRGLRGTVAPVAINGPAVSGNISTATLGHDFNWFSFSVAVPGSYEISTGAGTMKNSYLYVYGPDSQETYLTEIGTATSGGMASLTLPLNPGTYFIKAEGYLPRRDSGTYTLRVRCAIQGPRLPANGAWASGEIATQTPYNWFQFTVPSTGDYLIETAAGTLADTVLYLCGPNDPLKQAAWSNDIDARDHTSRLALPLKAGTYYVRVEGFQDARHSLSTGTYRLRAARIPWHGSTPLTIGAPPAAGAIANGGESDWYSFRIDRRGGYIIQTRPGTLRAGYLRLFGPNSQITLAGQDGGPGRMSRLLATLEPGFYYVRMQAYEPAGRGSYTIQVRPEVIPLTLDAAPLTQAVDAGAISQWFSFAVTETASYTIQTAAGTLRNNYLRLYGPNSRDALLAQKGSREPGNLACITRTLAPGTYYVLSQGLTAADAGTCQVSVSQNIQPLTVGSPAAWGAIDPAGASVWYRFQAGKEAKYTIETWAGSLKDNFLSLYGPEGDPAPLAQNDNGGAGNMAKIVIKLKPGTYKIRVDARYPADCGTYRIRVSK